jgi:betaine-aldehyde dehydrogenase
MPDDLSATLSAGVKLPERRGLFYGGAWHEPLGGTRLAVESPATGETLGDVAAAGAADVDAAVAAAREGFERWRRVPPLERAKILRRFGDVLREHARELALIDAIDGGNPLRALLHDLEMSADGCDYFAGLVTEMKGDTVPMGEGVVNYSVREPWGVVAKIIPFNHPIMFATLRAAAPLAAGNAVIVKTPEQAPLSALRLMEIAGDHFPPGVFNVLSGGREAGAALVAHPGVDKVALIGSVPAGRAVLHAAADRIKPVLLELGGKNALIAHADSDPAKVAAGLARGMNFTWCGQSCGSTSRAFLHADIHDAVVAELEKIVSAIRPGLPTRMETEMGSLISRAHHGRVMEFVESAHAEGAELLTGGAPPDDPELVRGCYLRPTVFTGVTPRMRIAREEIFGPVLSVLRWEDEAQMLRDVNAVEYGLTASIWTRNLATAHRNAAAVQAGFVWVNETSKHFIGTGFGGYKQSGLGREESIEELLTYTQSKNIHVRLEQ